MLRRAPSTLGRLLCPLLVGCVTPSVYSGRRCPEGEQVCVDAGSTPGPDAGTAGPQAHAASDAEAARDAECDGCDAAPGNQVSALCHPGVYAGRFHIATYRPVAAGFCGLFTVYGGSGVGELELTVPESPPVAGKRSIRSCLELQIENAYGVDAGAGDAGLADGGADAAVPAQPLSLELTAEVDCVTGRLDGTLRGVYASVSLCNAGTAEGYYSVKGFLSATYDARAEAFVDGVVDLREPQSLLAPLDSEPTGGAGSWRASRNPDAPVPTSAPATMDCLDGQPFTDFEVAR